MASRGRRSAASFSVISPISDHRPAPPDELTDEQANEWLAIVDRLPADWFKRETTPLLVALCRHIATARMLSRQIDRIDEMFEDVLGVAEGVAHLDRLLAMRAREVAGMAAMATKLRLTPQSRYTPGRAATESRKPAVNKLGYVG
jgi:hypothetical protein